MSTDNDITSLLTLIVVIDSLQLPSQELSKPSSFLRGAIQVYVKSDAEIDTSSAAMISSTRIIGQSSFTKKCHRFYNVSMNDCFHVSLLDDSNEILGRGSASLRLAKKDKLSISIYDLDHRVMATLACKLKRDDFDSSAAKRVHVVSWLSSMLSIIGSIGWIICGFMLILFVAYPFIKNEKQASYLTPGRFALNRGTTLYQGDFIFFCKNNPSITSKCDSLHFHLSTDGVFGLYQGSEVTVSSSSALWQVKPTEASIAIEEETKTNILQKFMMNLSKLMKKISRRGDYRLMLSHEDELILYRGKHILWKSKIEDIKDLHAFL